MQYSLVIVLLYNMYLNKLLAAHPV